MFRPQQEDFLQLDSIRAVQVIRRVLARIDTRLVSHGERVAFLAYSIIKDTPVEKEFDLHKLFILTTLHDVGAYKTEEIDNMVQFETETAFNHAVYGYLLLRHITPLAHAAEAILYHHTPYKELLKIDCDYKRYAQLIFLADRIDILHLSGKVPDLNAVIRSHAGNVFAPDLVELFISRNTDGAMTDMLDKERFMPLIREGFNKLKLTCSEILRYLYLIVFVIDFRSIYTTTHTVQTTGISAAIGRCLYLPEQQLFELTTGAFLHDLGKVSIPLSILEKPGTLTDMEMAVMRKHVTVTEDILSGIVDDTIFKIATRHHEKLDGSGYPNGLRGTDMTLCERIVAVADIVSALMGKHSYKEIFEDEKINFILRKMRDTKQLDQLAVNTMLRYYDTIKTAVKTENARVQQLYDTIYSEYALLTGMPKKDS